MAHRPPSRWRRLLRWMPALIALPTLAATLLLRDFTFWLPMVPGLWIARQELGRL